MQRVQHLRLEGHGVGKLDAQRVLGEAAAELVQRLMQHGFCDDQFADQVQQAVNAISFHSQDVVGTGEAGRLGSVYAAGARGIGKDRRQCRRGRKFSVRLSAVTGLKFLHHHLRHDARHMAFGQQVVLVVFGGKRKFQLVGGRPKALFRSSRQHGAGLPQNPLQQLDAGVAHRAIAGEAGGDVVNADSAPQRLSHAQLFVLAPGESGLQFAGGLR